MAAELFTDKKDPEAFRVEFIDHDNDGACEVAVFHGPRALERARTFAEAFYGTFDDKTA